MFKKCVVISAFLFCSFVLCVAACERKNKPWVNCSYERIFSEYHREYDWMVRTNQPTVIINNSHFLWALTHQYRINSPHFLCVMYVCVCVWVCVLERERKREGGRLQGFRDGSVVTGSGIGFWSDDCFSSGLGSSCIIHTFKDCFHSSLFHPPFHPSLCSLKG